MMSLASAAAWQRRLPARRACGRLPEAVEAAAATAAVAEPCTRPCCWSRSEELREERRPLPQAAAGSARAWQKATCIGVVGATGWR